MCFMYNVLCIAPFPETVLGPPDRECGKRSQRPRRGAYGCDNSYAHSLIKIHFVCVTPCNMGTRFCGAFATAQDQGAFPFSSKTPPTKREGNCRCGSYFLPGDPLLRIRFSRICRTISATQFRLIKVSWNNIQNLKIQRNKLFATKRVCEPLRFILEPLCNLAPALGIA
jgi:hypothetical protein